MRAVASVTAVAVLVSSFAPAFAGDEQGRSRHFGPSRRHDGARPYAPRPAPHHHHHDDGADVAFGLLLEVPLDMIVAGIGDAISRSKRKRRKPPAPVAPSGPPPPVVAMPPAAPDRGVPDGSSAAPPGAPIPGPIHPPGAVASAAIPLGPALPGPTRPGPAMPTGAMSLAELDAAAAAREAPACWRARVVVEPAVLETREFPVFEDVEVPVYEDRVVPVSFEVVTPVVEERVDPDTGAQVTVLLRERRETVVVGSRLERVVTGTRLERREVARRVETVVVRPATTRVHYERVGPDGAPLEGTRGPADGDVGPDDDAPVAAGGAPLAPPSPAPAPAPVAPPR